MRECRVSPGPRRDGKRTHGRTFTMHHPGSHRGEGGNRGTLGGPGCGAGNAGTTHRLPGKGDRSYSPGPRDGDGGSRTRTVWAVPGPRNSRGRARQQHLVGQQQRDGSPREAERKPEPAIFSPSPVIGQEQPPPMRTHVPETESSESDASDEPGLKEDPPHLMARPASDLEGDQEAAELDQEEAGGAEPSAQLELAIHNGLDISSLPALGDLSTRASTTVHIPWPPVGMEQATPEWRQKASPGDGVPPGRTRRRALRQLEWRVETTTGVPPRSPRYHDRGRYMDCQNAQQHGPQGAGRTSLRACHGT